MAAAGVVGVTTRRNLDGGVNACAALNRAMTEAQLQDAVIAFATTHKWRVMHTRPAWSNSRWVTPIQGDPGFPDLVLARDGRVLFFEVKTEKGKLMRDQVAWRVALDGCESEDDDWVFLLDEGPLATMGYAVVRPFRWSSGQVGKVLA